MSQVKMQVDVNITHRFFNDYVNSIDMWCTENCSGDYIIKVSKAPKYNFPTGVEIRFSKEEDATYFKLSPLWVEVVRE